MNEPLAKKIVRDAYGNPKVIACYQGNLALWRSEEVLVRRFFPREGKLLDLGCGAGRTSIPLTILGFEVVGIDISSSMLKAAILEAERLNLKIDFQEMDAKSLDFADRSFDCALYSFNGLDHIPGYNGKLEVLREVFRVLKPGAPFIFSSHRIWSPFHLRKLVLSGLKMSIGRLLGLNTLEREWGEVYDLDTDDPEERYSSFLAVGRWKKAIHAAGFEIIFHQSRYRLESERLCDWLKKSLSSGNYMFFVVRKPFR